MITKKCEYCPKVIEGYTKHQVGYMMEQHQMGKHRKLIEKKHQPEKLVDANI